MTDNAHGLKPWVDTSAAAGTGGDAIFIHGLGGAPTIWSRVVSRLDPTLRPFSFSYEVPSASARSANGRQIGAWAATLVAELPQDTGRPTVLVGHSLGASIALEAAVAAPSVSALVLLGADADISRLGPRFSRVIELIREVGWDRWITENWRTNLPFSPAALRSSPDIAAEYEDMLRANDPETYMALCEVIRTAKPVSPEVKELRIPAVVAVGADDDRTPPASSRELAEMLPSARLEVVTDVGHSLPLETPDLVAQWVAELAKASRRAAST